MRSGGGSGGRANFVTIATPDRAAQSRIFARSARACHPDARLAVLVLESDAPRRLFADSFDLVVAAEELSLGGLADMRFRYSTAELCFALKPWLIRHLLEKLPGEPIYYFDSDIELFTHLAEVETALAHGANLVLTPHILQPGPDQTRDRALLRSGAFNAGFLALAPSAPARGFVDWWCDRVRTGCTNDHPEGPYGDQKWLDLAPSICESVVVLRHPGYNFAYWNAYERPLSRRGGTWSAAGSPLRFVHYSQWNLREQDAQQYLARYFRHQYEPFAGLFADYQKKVTAEGHFGAERAPAIYGEVLAPSGKPVPDLLRRAYEWHGPALDGDAGAVFAAAICVLNAPSQARLELPLLPITVLYDEIWQNHGDLQHRFAIDQRSGRLAYLRWLIERGAAELGIPDAFVTPARSALEGEAGGTAEAPADSDIALLVSSNKALRRELHGLRVRRWRDEETIQALGEELAQASRKKSGRQPALAGDGPFFQRGFRLSEAGVIAGTTVQRVKRAPSGTLVFGPYIALAAGTYAATVEARLYQHLPVLANFRLEIVCDAARQRIASRTCRLCSLARRRRFELIFTVGEDEDYRDCEVRIWARRGTPLEIGRIGLCRLTGSPPRA